jgi:hypothetical protein
MDIVEIGPRIVLGQVPADLALCDVPVKKARIFGALVLQTGIMVPIQNRISSASLLRNLGRIIDIALPFITSF